MPHALNSLTLFPSVDSLGPSSTWPGSSAWLVKWGPVSTTFGGGASEIPMAASDALSAMACHDRRIKMSRVHHQK